MKDTILKDNVVAKLEFEPSIDGSDIGVAVEDGIVTLSGHVPSCRRDVLRDFLPGCGATSRCTISSSG